MTARDRARRLAAWSPLVVLSVLAAVLSVVVHETLFPHGSVDNDEVAYLLHAQSIAHGHLFLDSPQPASAYQPWFFTPGPHGLVSKYLPVVSALYAAGLVLFG